MKRFVKFNCFVCLLLLCSIIFVGCGGDKTETAKTDGTNFTYWTVMDNASAVTLASYNEMLFYQEMEKQTGVHIDFIHPMTGSTGNESFLTMLSGSEIPDMIEYDWAKYTGGPQQALDDELLLCLNDYLEEYAPNYYDNLEGKKGKANNYLYKLQTSTDDGRYYGFNVLNIGTLRGFSGLYVRGDKLKEWNMEIPETIDEWTAVFAKAKSEGFAKPFTTIQSSITFDYVASHSFNTAYDVGKDLYLEGDKVVFAPFQKGYKDYVAQLAEWTKAGYIDTGFITNDNAKVEGYITNGISVAAWGNIGSGLGKLIPAGQTNIPGFQLVACPYPVLDKGDKSEFQAMSGEAKTLAIGISTACGNYEKAISWCDFIYSEEGMELQLFGVEGDTYTVEEKDGEKHYVYTDKILKHEGLNSVSEALYKHMLPANHPGYNQHADYLDGYYTYEEQKDAVVIWNENSEAAKLHTLPTLNLTEEESDEIKDILEIAKSELEIGIFDIILGHKSIDTYDDVIKKAKKNGMDRYIEINQIAYERYIAKLNK